MSVAAILRDVRISNLLTKFQIRNGYLFRTLFAKTDMIIISYKFVEWINFRLKTQKDSSIQAVGDLIAVNLTLSTFPCTISRSSMLGGGVNSSPGQHAIALSSVGVRVCRDTI